MKLDFEEVDFPKNLSSSSLLNGAKLRQSMDCPVDTLIIRGVDFVSPMAFKLHLTPNILTTISVAFKVLALFNLYSGSRGTRWYFVLFAILAYVFDCFDGHYARKYSQCSVFGDYYDHISDWSYFLLLFLCTFIRGVESAALTVFLGTICLALAISAAFRESNVSHFFFCLLNFFFLFFKRHGMPRSCLFDCKSWVLRRTIVEIPDVCC